MRFEEYREKGRLKKVWIKIICENIRTCDADEKRIMSEGERKE